ncbi:hypothetical protein HHI36_008254 [Cryptolaemus montrouzieri]|uniref:Uncharacterized protein n=1 Tax=Cryptolaemus montrouzieri TaxID=559131 RepID=A0ABD2MRU4_9CUCU
MKIGSKITYPETWAEGGIEGSRYNMKANGWFDTTMFEDWFNQIILPNVRNLNGPKVLRVPFDPDVMWKKVPQNTAEKNGNNENTWTQTLVDHLSTMRAGPSSQNPEKRKKINIAQGKSDSVRDRQ